MTLPDSFPYPSDLIDKLGDGMKGVYDHIQVQESKKLEEVVGLVLDQGQHVPLVNQARSYIRFDIGPTQFDDVVRNLPSDLRVLAFYHSHPAGNLTPSIEDQDQMLFQFARGIYFPWLIATTNPHPHARLHWVDPLYGAVASYDLPVTIHA